MHPRVEGTRYRAWSVIGFLVLSLSSSAVVAQAGFVVVAAPDVPVSTLTVDELSELFLKKNTRWEGGAEVVPVEQSEEGELRLRFIREVHDRDLSAMKSYWQMQIFTGKASPPVTLEDDGAVLGFVANRPGAIGYVSPDAEVPDGVKVIEITDG